MGHYAAVTDKFAYLSSDFGKQLAMRKFKLIEDELKKLMGVYVRGKRKGLIKGGIAWELCTKGGWVATSYRSDGRGTNGYVLYPGSSGYKLVKYEWGKEPEIVAEEHLLHYMTQTLDNKCGRTQYTKWTNNMYWILSELGSRKLSTDEAGDFVQKQTIITDEQKDDVLARYGEMCLKVSGII